MERTTASRSLLYRILLDEVGAAVDWGYPCIELPQRITRIVGVPYLSNHKYRPLRDRLRVNLNSKYKRSGGDALVGIHAGSASRLARAATERLATV